MTYFPTKKKCIIICQDEKLFNELTKLLVFFNISIFKECDLNLKDVDLYAFKESSHYVVVHNEERLEFTFNQALGYLIRSILEILNQEIDDCFFIHGGCVEKEGRVTCLLGKTKSGKSTITNALCNYDFNYLTDDLICINSNELVSSFPKPIFSRSSIKTNKLNLINIIEYEDEYRYCYLPDWHVPTTHLLPIKDIIILERDESFKFMCEKMTFGKAFLGIWENMYNSENLLNKRKIAIELAKHTNVYQVYYDDFLTNFENFKVLLW